MNLQKPSELTPVSVGEALRHQRTLAGLGLRETARLAGLSPAHISEVERDHTSPSPDTITRLVSVYARDRR